MPPTRPPADGTVKTPGGELARVWPNDPARVYAPHLAAPKPSGNEMGRQWPNGPPGGSSGPAPGQA
jgi:hypothetical protein